MMMMMIDGHKKRKEKRNCCIGHWAQRKSLLDEHLLIWIFPCSSTSTETQGR